jgi:hypothetical protein
MCGWVGGKRGNDDWERGPKIEQLTVSIGPARAEVRSYVQRATIPSKRVTCALNINKIPHMR